jgi:hypothetical protein
VGQAKACPAFFRTRKLIGNRDPGFPSQRLTVKSGGVETIL